MKLFDLLMLVGYFLLFALMTFWFIGVLERMQI